MLKISHRDLGDVRVVDLKGQIDGGPDSERLHEAIKEYLQQGKKKLVLNMTELRWVNSLGVGTLVAAYVSAKREDVVLSLVGTNERVRFVVERVVPKLFTLFDSEEDAVRNH